MDAAFAELMRQAESHAWYAEICSDPLVAPLWKDTRFPGSCRKVGLPV